MWRWYHNISECYYHIQITVKYRKSLLSKGVEALIAPLFIKEVFNAVFGELDAEFRA